jgi:DnaJ-class molecular chaperone
MDYYNTLGLQRGASDADIKKAYRSLAMKHHPDRGGDPKTFQDIQAAYDTLSDPGRRQEYDNPQPSFGGDPFGGQQGGVPPGFEDMFRFFGGNDFGPFFRASVPKNRNIQLQATVTLEDAFHGKELVVNVRLPSGREQMINVKVPAGVHDGVNLRLAGMGDDSMRNAPRGDVIVHVTLLPHPTFTRQGDDLVQEISIDAIEAMLGKDITINTIEGKQFTGNIPAGTQPDSILGIGGLGMPNMNNPTVRGRMLLKIKVTVPTLNQRQQELLKTVWN